MIKRIIWMAMICGVFAGFAAADFVPGDPASVGLNRIVDDSTAGDIGAHDGYQFTDGVPYCSVLGGDTFLINCGTWAEDITLPAPGTRERFALIIQKDNGDPYAIGDAFFADDGTPYRNFIYSFRPGRVAGDMRPGARFFMAAGEAAIHNFPGVFGTLPAGPTYTSSPQEPVHHYGCAQMYSLDTTTLEQSMASEAFDVLQGVTGMPAVDEDASRFGGEAVALSNGNFVVYVDDQTQLVLPVNNVPVATIVKSNGDVVKPAFSLWPAGSGTCKVWSNLAAYNGGFVIRTPYGVLRFFDNDGNFRGQIDQNVPEMQDSQGNRVYLRVERGDESRIAGHINSDYVFIGSMSTTDPGDSSPKQVCSVAAYNAVTMEFAGLANVSELAYANGGIDPAATEDLSYNYSFNTPRVVVAVDALNRLAIAHSRAELSYIHDQILVRVMQFHPGTDTFSHLTHSFWPFINTAHSYSDPNDGVEHKDPSIAITTNAICVAATGIINLSNNTNEPPDSAVGAHFYTVIEHPDPQTDPTPPATLPTNCPTITGISPDFVIANGGLIEDITITGSNFVPGNTSVRLVIVNENLSETTIEIPAAEVTVAGDGNSLTFDRDFAGADGGVRTVFVSVTGGGDPPCPDPRLADAFTISECYVPFADIDGDGFVDQDDFAALQRCLTIGGGTYPDACKCFNRDADEEDPDDIDLDDVAEFADCATGPAVPWNALLAPDCNP